MKIHHVAVNAKVLTGTLPGRGNLLKKTLKQSLINSVIHYTT
jgi:hypothetical protein